MDSKEVRLAVTNYPEETKTNSKGEKVEKPAYKTCKLLTHVNHLTNDPTAVYNCPKGACEGDGALFYFEKSFTGQKQKAINWLNANQGEEENQENHYGEIVAACNLSFRQIHEGFFYNLEKKGGRNLVVFSICLFS
jgi:hypothetical protein